MVAKSLGVRGPPRAKDRTERRMVRFANSNRAPQMSAGG